jgi:hypothetical protein
MNMRNIYKGEASRNTNRGEAWAELWDKSQRHAAKPTTVIYGHDARRVFFLEI